MFLQDAQFYCDLTKPIFVELDKDIDRHAGRMEAYKQVKEVQLKKTVSVLGLCMRFESSESFGTLRKVQFFGNS